MKKILKTKLPELWQKIDADFDLFLPIEKNKTLNFSLWKEGEKVNLDRVRTNASPKHLVFPQTETYLKFKNENKKLSLEVVEAEGDEYVLFGVRPCDVKSFKLLDNIFLRDPVDTYYKVHRDRGIIISLGCSNPEDTCFCTSFGVEAASAPEGADIAAWDMGDSFLWKTQSEKGQKLMESVEEFFTDAHEKDLKTLEHEKDNIREKLKELPFSNIDLSKIKGTQQEIFDQEEIWNEFSEKCLACGTCSYLCPTCHCYDLCDYKGSNKGEKFRCWDSCMSSDFTLMAHGNPRTSQMQRLRQRFMHKLVYYPKNHEGVYSCVGCGRCADRCPVHIDIVKIIKKLGGEKNEL
ncbi:MULTISPECIES: 4Fe-4S dicluster domain-containing protein [Psychrilyobacter]|uniref:4Fe-4S ferredoxin n=1 Tax=Psychrilyobacter piezotolerans TaxID=2293438 RepID=A0ABX9KFH9_9FUSO|nr:MULTISPECIES: 4Fe-4S dicluster domain-containing protein [Psychrilyobacter]MCS5422143.1 4Fe-4S dicluster domain-containing protein [Psychrilyobacter sp. S5]NDI78453.1 4Fe-4S ferredoxin [Psychrilyobacter piezotolerans]RDE60637.1 4Fe-4S ferredoxin [Psychrilyobacter sp. S5]REI40564.1 4Fe-4S ferredoxin [Psychrilyobacter piezotolerans]